MAKLIFAIVVVDAKLEFELEFGLEFVLIVVVAVVEFTKGRDPLGPAS